VSCLWWARRSVLMGEDFVRCMLETVSWYIKNSPWEIRTVVLGTKCCDSVAAGTEFVLVPGGGLLAWVSM
jgi:hypothetical protein